MTQHPVRFMTIALAATMLVTAWLTAGPAAAQTGDWPTRTVKLVVPQAAGGGTDFLGRLFAERLQSVFGQPFIVDNRVGAGGIIGLDVVAKANHDGYTLAMPSSGYATLPAISAQLPFDPRKDLTAITLTVVGAYALVAPPSLGAKSIKELIALALSKPGQLNFASAGIGSGTHFAAELFKDLAKIDVVHVAYRGIPDGLTDTIAGRVQFFMPPLASATPLVKDGKLLALAVSRRVAGYESIPTMAESGLRGYNWDAWSGLMAPGRTPRAIINKLNREITRILALPDIKQRIVALGADSAPSTPAEFDKLIAEQIVMTTGLARRAGIQPQ